LIRQIAEISGEKAEQIYTANQAIVQLIQSGKPAKRARDFSRDFSRVEPANFIRNKKHLGGPSRKSKGFFDPVAEE
jgi:hypothetical protein